jgi:hypothetical protein
MKTKLPSAITTIEEAKSFLRELYVNGESFHPEDAAQDIVWALPKEQQPTTNECIKLNNLMNEIYNLEGNGNSQKMAFDPCGYLLELQHENKEYLLKDHSGRGESRTMSYVDFVPHIWDLDSFNEDEDMSLGEFLSTAEIGDTFEFDAAQSLTRTK